MNENGPVYLRLCTNEMLVVSQGWWDKFLRSQAKTMNVLTPKKIILDKGTERTSIESRGSSTDGIFVDEKERREERRTVQV